MCVTSVISSLSPYSTQLVTNDATVYYNYSIIGTFTIKVKVVAQWEQAMPDAGKGTMQKTGDFSASLKLQGASLRLGSAHWRTPGTTPPRAGSHADQSSSHWGLG